MNVHYLSGGEGFPVITKEINRLDKAEDERQKQNRWRGISEKNHKPPETPLDEVKEKAERQRARYILQTSVGTYYIKCFPREGYQIPTSGELWDQIWRCRVPTDFRGKKSRVWILDYRDE